MHSHTNRLAGEKSPYLLQHAHNPVAWYPWGEEAFAVARAADKPVFLSIGYATCHWCHVMERESFEDVEVAALLNEAFVCIKVDREERPDIDHIYMAVCQMMTGSGGWPLTIFMTPGKQPFHAATYIPPEQRFGRIGMKQLVPRVAAAWKDRREEVLESAGQILAVLEAHQSQDIGGAPEAALLDAGFRELMEQYDSRHGGFGLQPKFPTPHRLVFLLRHGTAAGLSAAEHTLVEMRKGGIFDQVGFGFHRYSTDRLWLVPHFEKMLYDQALLATAYTEAFEATRTPFYRQVACEILAYVARDMMAPEGGFYSAEDADSEGEEGRFYVWPDAEARAVLGEEHGFAASLWNLAERGNFHDEASGQASGTNIPHLSELPEPDTAQRLEPSRQRLFAVREKRVHPLKDTKVLADWNGLMIAAFAKAGRVFGAESLLKTAIRCQAFMATHLRRDNGELWHRWRDGDCAVEGTVDDYAFQIAGLLELYRATFDPRFLEQALEFNDILSRSFIDAERGGYFMTADHAEELIVRPKDLYDGAIPSGNSVQWMNLLQLARLTGSPKLERQANETARAFGGAIGRSPSNFAQALQALHFAVGETLEIVVVGERDCEGTNQMLATINNRYKPGMVVLLKDSKNAERLEKIAPFTAGQGLVDGKTTAYVCRNFACERPVTAIAELEERLGQPSS